MLDDKEHADGCRHEVGEREERHEEQIAVELLVHGTDVAVHYKHAERVDNAHGRLSQQTQEGVDSETGGIVGDDKHADGIDTETENPRKEEKQGEMAFYTAPALPAAPSPLAELHELITAPSAKRGKDNSFFIDYDCYNGERRRRYGRQHRCANIHIIIDNRRHR